MRSTAVLFAATTVGVPIAVNWTQASGWTFVGVFVALIATGQLYPRPYVNRIVKQYEDRLAEVVKDRDTWRTLALEQTPVKANLALAVRELVHEVTPNSESHKT